MVKPSVAIIIPMHNRASVIHRALDSILLQSRRPDRLIVVDDGSTDNGLAEVDRWQRRRAPDFPIVSIRQHNQGCSVARNRGAELARDCDLLLFLDSDDALPIDLVPQACATMASDSRLVAAFRDSRFVWQGKADLDINDTALFAADPLRCMRTNLVPPVPSATVIRGWGHFRIGGYDPTLPCHEDTDYMLRLSLVGPMAWLPGAPVPIHRMCTKRQFQAATPTHRSARINTAAGHFTLAQIWSRHLQHVGYQQASSAQCREFLYECWEQAARAFLREGRRREAAWCFDRALDHNPNDWKSRWRRFRSLPLGDVLSPAA